MIGLPPVINPPIYNTGAGGWFGVAGRGVFLIVGIFESIKYSYNFINHHRYMIEQ